jgi:Domain of unknown function (DUF4294)
MCSFRTYLLFCLAAAHTGRVVAQEAVQDSIPLFHLHPAIVEGKLTAKARRNQAKYDKLTHNVLRTYPYAEVTSQLLDQYSWDLERINKEKGRDHYLALAEAELKAEFEGEVRDLTISQGRVLIKLIDRQTGNTSYELIKELRGSFAAFIWQGVAHFFGTDLKDNYEPEGEDAMIEHIVKRIESGELVVAPRPARTTEAQARLLRKKARLYKKYDLPAAVSSGR